MYNKKAEYAKIFTKFLQLFFFFTTFAQKLLLTHTITYKMGMNYTAYYSVAEHLFAIDYDNSELIGLLSNYAPFFVNQPSSIPIFSLRIHSERLLSDSQRNLYTHLYTEAQGKPNEVIPKIDVYTYDDSWLIRISQTTDTNAFCEVLSDRMFNRASLYIAPQCQDIRFCIDTALMLIYAFRTASLGTLLMHASVVVKNSEKLAYLFLGQSGTGKSTHARFWLQTYADGWLLNDDNPILRLMDDGQVYVFGSPWSGKTPCYMNQRARVGGIIQLSQAHANKVRSLSLPEKYANMQSATSGLKIDHQMADYLHETIKHIITQITCIHLECLPNTEAAQLCYTSINS